MQIHPPRYYINVLHLKFKMSLKMCVGAFPVVLPLRLLCWLAYDAPLLYYGHTGQPTRN
jgi:hypothetical protein